MWLLLAAVSRDFDAGSITGRRMCNAGRCGKLALQEGAADLFRGCCCHGVKDESGWTPFRMRIEGFAIWQLIIVPSMHVSEKEKVVAVEQVGW